MHQARRLVNDLVLESTSRSCLGPAKAPVSFKRRLDGRPSRAQLIGIILGPEESDDRGSADQLGNEEHPALGHEHTT